MLRNFMKLILLESFLIGFLAPQRVFIHLNLVDFDRTAAQILNGENSRRVLTGSSNNTLKFSYNLIKLADREVKKLANQGFISPPDLQVTLNMRNIIAKVDKYSNVIDQNTPNLKDARKCFDNYSSFVYKPVYWLNENCIAPGEQEKTTEYGFSRSFDSLGNVFFIQLYAYDRLSAL